MNLRRIAPLLVALPLATTLGLEGCNKGGETVLLKVTTDDPSNKVDKYDLYVWETSTRAQVLHTGWTDATHGGKKTDWSKDPLEIGLTLPNKTPTSYTFMMVGVIGQTDGDKPVADGSAKQFFFARRVNVDGNVQVDAQLLNVPFGDDKDRDLWPDGDPMNASNWLAHNATAQSTYGGADPDRSGLLDCDDKTPEPVTTGANIGTTVDPAQIHPFAVELCGDGIDENCDGNGDEACVDTDNDGDPDCQNGQDPKTCDCAPTDPTRHHPIRDPMSPHYDPYPQTPNCCAYNFGVAGAAGEMKEGSCNMSPCMTGALCHTSNTPGNCDDGIDQDCSGVDTACVPDSDCDSYKAGQQPTNFDMGDGPACNAPSSDGNDCNDCDPNIHPGAPEICGDGIDNNCNGIVDEGCVSCDLDGDGYQRMDTSHAQKCPDPAYVASGKAIDCNDEDSGVFPGSTKTIVPLPYLSTINLATCSGKEGGTAACAIRNACTNVNPSGTAQDADCDGVAAEGCPNADPKLMGLNCDVDGDGFVDVKKAAMCDPMNQLQHDCDDSDPHTFPQAPERCGDGKTQNCAGQDVPCTQDADHDGYNADTDCNDNDPMIHPWATESCNGKDDDCDGLIDELNPDATGKPMVDATNKSVTHCNDSSTGECGNAKFQGDCVCSVQSLKGSFLEQSKRVSCPGENQAVDDASNAAARCFFAYQPKPQSCSPMSPKDDDCDGRVDDPTGKNLQLVIDKALCWPGAKGQCLGAATAKVVGCDMSQQNCFNKAGVTPASAGDAAGNPWIVCDTKDANMDPVACPVAELCNGLDDNCDGMLPVNEQDTDKDHYLACGGDPAAGYMMPPEPCQTKLATGILGCGDCNDMNAAQHPTAAENCNNIDDDCDVRTPDGSGQCAPGGPTPVCCSAQAAAAGAGPAGGTQFCKNTKTDTQNCGACTAPSTSDHVCDAVRANMCVNGGCSCGGGGAACQTNSSSGMSSDWCNAGTCQHCTTNSHCGPSCIACSGSTSQCKADATGCVECNVDADCTNGWCNVTGGNKCVAKVANGQKCVPNTTDNTGNNQCSSGNCVDGVCCNMPASACGACYACIGALTGGSDGACMPVRGGLSVSTYPSFHQNPCTASTANCKLAVCAGDGTCNAAANTSCGSASCANQTETDPTCDNAGNCKMPTKSCGGYLCNGSATCLASCNSDNDCDLAHYCTAGHVCAAQKAKGSACKPSTDCVGGGNCRECDSTNAAGGCVDGYCCDTTCANGCDYCNLGGQLGTCSVASQGNAGANPGCSPYVCNGSSASCPSSCTMDTDCAAGYYCASNSCTPKASNGATCTMSNQCSSANCQPANDSTGKRCKASGGTCSGCQGVNASGACANFTMSGLDPNNSCAGSCATGCNTSGSCAYKAGGTLCGSGFACSGSSAMCPATCTNGTDVNCNSGYYCTGGNTCNAKDTGGGLCTANDECASNVCAASNDQAGVKRCKASGGACSGCQGVDSSGNCNNVTMTGLDPNSACTTGCNNGCLTTGSCQPASSGTACGTGYVCDGTSTSCPMSCTPPSTNCATGYFCNVNVCAALLAAGKTCTLNSDCTSNNCQPANDSASGKRCKASGGACTGCQGVNSSGLCANVTMAGFDPNNVCTGTCQGQGCTTSNTCRGGNAGSACGTGGYVCSGSSPTCPTACTADSGCQTGYFCGNASGGTCVTQVASSGMCNTANASGGGDCQVTGCRECTGGACQMNGKCP